MPLAGEFMFGGQKVFVVANHWSCKGGDDPLFGPIQPPVQGSEAKRVQQAQVVADFVDEIYAKDPTPTSSCSVTSTTSSTPTA